MKSLTVLCLLACAAAALSLGDYSHHLAEGDFDHSLLFLFPQPCDGFLAPVEVPASIESNEAFEGAVKQAMVAEEEFASAAWFALLQKTARNMGFSGDGLNRYASYACFKHGANGLNAAARAAKSGLEATDSRLAELDAMLDSSFTGPAAGFLEDLDEAESLIGEWNSTTDSFGSGFVRAADGLDFARAGLASLPSAHSMVAAADSLYSLLDSECGLYEEAGAAIASVEEEYFLSLDSAESLEASVKEALGEARDLELESVQEDAFLSVGAGGKATTGYEVNSFEEDYSEAKSLSAFSSWSIDEAERKWRSKDAGYASRAVMSLRNASSTLEACASIIAGYSSRGYWLENELRERVNEELAGGFELARSHDDPYAFTGALHDLRAAVDSADEKVPVLGERINLFLRLLARAESLKEELSAWERGAFDAKARVESEAERVASVLEAAESDGLGVDWERKRLAEIKAAAGELGSSEKDASAALLLESDLAALEEGVFASAAREYAAELEAHYSFVAPLAGFLSASKHEEFSEAAAYFDGGFLDVQSALGGLSGLRDSLSGLAAHARLQSPNILRAHLTETASVEVEAEEPFPIGGPVELRVRVFLANALPVSYGGLLKVEVEGIPDFDGLAFNSTERAFHSGGAFFLEGVGERDAVEFDSVFERVLAVPAGESYEVEYANGGEARAKRSYLFDSSWPGRVLLNATLLPRERVLSARSDSSTARWSEGGAAFAWFGEGRHWFELECAAVEPVGVTRSVTVGEGITVDYSLQNDYLPLDSFEYSDFLDLECEPSSFQSGSSDGVAVEVEASRQSFVRLTASDLASGETAWARVSFECDSIAEAAEEKFASIAIASNGSFEEELLEIQSLLQSGDYGNALSKAFDLEDELFESVAASETNSEFDAFKEQVIAYASLAEDESLAEALFAAAELGGYDSAFSAVEEIAEARVYSLKSKCKECVGEANSFLAVGDPLSAIESVAGEEARLQDEGDSEEEELARLQSELSDYSASRGGALALLSEFEAAFAVGEGNAPLLEESKAYSDASRYKKALESELKALDKAVVDPLKYSASIGPDLDDYRAAFNSLESSLASLKSDAEEELALAGTQQARFGNAESQPLLLEAQAEFDSGAYYSAYLLANSLRHSLLDLSGGSASPDSAWRLSLGAFGVLCLGALAFLFTRRERKPTRSV